MIRQVIIGGRDVSEHIQRNVAKAAKPSAQQIARLRMLFAPVTVDATLTTITRSKAVRPRADKAA